MKIDWKQTVKEKHFMLHKFFIHNTPTEIHKIAQIFKSYNDIQRSMKQR